MRVLCLNAGAASLRLALFELAGSPASERRLGTAAVARIGQPGTQVWLRDADDKPVHEQAVALGSHAEALTTLLAAMSAQGWPAAEAVGHRLVHGGPAHAQPERVDAALLSTLPTLVPYAPLHMPAALSVLRAARAHFSELPHVVCFDTAFHRDIPLHAARLPLPRALHEAGVRRCGAHGLSYEYVVQALGADGQGRLVIAHLGHGSSVAAVHNGKPLDTSSGFTPVGGIMMATRCGDLDPGVLLHLQREHGYDLAKLSQLVEHECGLRGISGSTADMETLLAQRESQPHAAEAVDAFCYQLKKQIGAYSAVLGGIDTLVFTGGMGEHAPYVRDKTCAGLTYLGIEINPPRNQANARIISRTGGRCTVRVVPTDEERMIARHTVATLRGVA